MKEREILGFFFNAGKKQQKKQHKRWGMFAVWHGGGPQCRWDSVWDRQRLPSAGRSEKSVCRRDVMSLRPRFSTAAFMTALWIFTVNRWGQTPTHRLSGCAHVPVSSPPLPFLKDAVFNLYKLQCVSILFYSLLWLVMNLSRVPPCRHPMTAGRGFSRPP